MSLFLIRSTLRRGWARRTRDRRRASRSSMPLYAAAGAAGAAPAVWTIGPLRAVLGLAGAAVLIVLGARTLHSRSGCGTGSSWRPRSPRRAARF